jgi:hypothetical protein
VEDLENLDDDLSFLLSFPLMFIIGFSIKIDSSLVVAPSSTMLLQKMLKTMKKIGCHMQQIVTKQLQQFYVLKNIFWPTFMNSKLSCATSH